MMTPYKQTEFQRQYLGDGASEFRAYQQSTLLEDNMNEQTTTDSDPFVFHVPGKPGIIDVAIERNGVLTGAYSGEALDQIQLRYPGAEIGRANAIHEATEAMYRHGPTEITEARFTDMLEVLPPLRWKRTSDAEVFFLSEHTYGSITSIYARLGDRYFEMSDSISTDHDLVIAACEKMLHAS